MRIVVRKIKSSKKRVKKPSKKREVTHRLGIVLADKEKVFLFLKTTKGRKAAFKLAASSDGFNFKVLPDNPIIEDEIGKVEDIKKCEDFQISKLDGKYFLTYKYFTRKDRYVIRGALSNDLIHWKKIGKLSKIKESCMVIPNYKYNGSYVAYFGESSIWVAFSKKLKRWNVLEQPVLQPRYNYFDSPSIEVGNCVVNDRGICLIYNVKDGEKYTTVGSAIFDKNNIS